MDVESVEKEIKELKENISKERDLGKPKAEQYKLLEKELGEGVQKVAKWLAQIEALEKVLNN